MSGHLVLSVCYFWSLLTATVVTGAAVAFDLDTDNAPTDLIEPTAVPYIFLDVSPSGGDASLILRLTTVLTNSWFDATAPYHPTAVGVYSRIPRRPASESTTNRNLNIAALYASLRVLNSLAPQIQYVWRDMLSEVGLDPDDDSTDLSSPIGIGNYAGNAIVRARENDGMNQLGYDGHRRYNPRAYDDYTGYTPVNTAYDVIDPSKWQPAVLLQGLGLYKVQQFVTPQYAYVKPYSYKTPKKWTSPPPHKSNPHNFKAYRAQADEVLRASAELTDEKKMITEFFDNKLFALGGSIRWMTYSHSLGLLDFIHLDFLANMAVFDAGIFVWQEKLKYDAVRPFTAIKHIYGHKRVTAWGGPGVGKVHDLPANEWKSYLNVSDHPEYPSASSCLCHAHAEAGRLYFGGSDDLNFVVPVPAGSSHVEPGVTPSKDINLTFKTWTQYAEVCGQSRLWGGVHFQSAINEGKYCTRYGKIAYDFVTKLISGKAEPLRD